MEKLDLDFNRQIKLDWLFMLSLGLVFFIVIFYNVSVLLGLSSFAYVGLLVAFVTVTVLYVLLPDTFSRILYLVGLTLCLPMISHPVEMLPAGLQESIKNLIVYGDRIQIRFIVLTLVSFYLCLEIFLSLLVKKSVYLIHFMSFSGLLLLVVFSHEYIKLSILQVILDLGQILVCAAIFCYFRMDSYNKLPHKRTDVLVQTIFGFLCFILLIDILVTLLGVVSWTSTSWRSGYRGLFYAAESPYAWILGIGFTYTLMRLKYLSVAFVIILSLAAIYLTLTNIKTATAAFIMATLLFPILQYRILNKLALPITISCMVLIVFYILTAEETNSIAARIGTYIAYFYSLIEYPNWLIGIKPGVTEFTGPSNLANSLFATDFASNIWGVNDNLIHELIIREGYEEGGAFLPHNVVIALTASYGVILLVPAFYYHVTQPWSVLKNINPYNKLTHSLSGVVIYMALYGFLHPMIILAPLVVFVEILRVYNLQHRRLAVSIGDKASQIRL